MTSPVTIRYRQLPTDVARDHILTVAVIDTLGARVDGVDLAPTTAPTRITEANKGALGSDGNLLDAYTHLTGRATVNFWAMPVNFAGDDDADTLALNNALDILVNDATKEAMGGFGPDVVVLLTKGVDAASAGTEETPISKAGGHAISNRWAAVFVNAEFHTGAPTQATLTLWAATNVHPGILAVANKGSGTTPGRVLAAEHYVRYISGHDFGVNPIGVAFHAADVATPDPAFAFGLENGSAPANALAGDNLSLFIRYAGDVFLWGGKLETSAAATALDTVGHRLVAKRFSEQTVRAGFHLVGQRVTIDQLEDLQTQVQNIAAIYVDEEEAASIDVHLPRIEAGMLKHGSTIRFFDTVDAYELDVEIGHVEVQAL